MTAEAVTGAVSAVDVGREDGKGTAAALEEGGRGLSTGRGLVVTGTVLVLDVGGEDTKGTTGVLGDERGFAIGTAAEGGRVTGTTCGRFSCPLSLGSSLVVKEGGSASSAVSRSFKLLDNDSDSPDNDR